jgi:hypothetical protein
VNSRVAGGTDTRVLVWTVLTFAMDARVRITFINLVFAVVAVVSRIAAAFVSVFEWLAVAMDTRI